MTVEDLLKKLDAAPILRILAYFYKEVLQRPQPGFWVAPGALPLFGDIVVPTQWGATVAVEPRPGADIELRTMNRPAESFAVALDDLAPGVECPPWAAEPLAVLWSLRAAGHAVGGCSIVLHSELPRTSALSTPTPVACAVAYAACGEFELEVQTSDLITIVTAGLREFGHPARTLRAQVAAALTLGAGEALDGTTFGVLPLDLTAARLRLLIVDPHSDAPEARAVVAETALTHGALGTFVVDEFPGRPVVVLLPATALGIVRGAVVAACDPVPSFVTTGDVRRAGRAE